VKNGRGAVQGRYVPALAFRSLTPFYDTVLRRLFDEASLKRRLIELAGIRPGERVINVGCGTGTLLRQLAEAEPLCRPFGVDGDLAMLTGSVLPTTT
jgi:ubiquinone/menaquinone biosynthesis C-methylase UbiE